MVKMQKKKSKNKILRENKKDHYKERSHTSYQKQWEKESNKNS